MEAASKLRRRSGSFARPSRRHREVRLHAMAPLEESSLFMVISPTFARSRWLSSSRSVGGPALQRRLAAGEELLAPVSQPRRSHPELARRPSSGSPRSMRRIVSVSRRAEDRAARVRRQLPPPPRARGTSGLSCVCPWPPPWPSICPPVRCPTKLKCGRRDAARRSLGISPKKVVFLCIGFAQVHNRRRIGVDSARDRSLRRLAVPLAGLPGLEEPCRDERGSSP
jgi:hypothetical protein